jgi:hypothetical protein
MARHAWTVVAVLAAAGCADDDGRNAADTGEGSSTEDAQDRDADAPPDGAGADADDAAEPDADAGPPDAPLDELGGGDEDAAIGEGDASIDELEPGDEDGAGSPDDGAADEADVWGWCDGDHDGYFSTTCGGDDCDDARRDVHPLAVENCADGVDNDCNGRTDGEDSFCDPTACVPPHPPTDVGADGSFRADWHEATAWEEAFHLWTCMLPAGLPAWQAYFRVTLAEARDVRVVVTDGGPADVALVRGCDPETAVAGECVESWPGGGTFRDVASGTYLLVAEFEEWMPDGTPTTTDVAIDVSFSTPTPPPPNDRCEAAVDVSAGGTFAGTTLGAHADYEAPMCSSRSFADVAYRFTIAETSDVELQVDPAFNIVVASDCGALRLTHRACRRGWASLGALPAGTYYALVGVGSSTSDEAAPFVLQVRVRTPSVPIPNDTCATPADVSPGVPESADLFGATNSLAGTPVPGTVCGSTIYDGEADAFYRFALPSTRHLDVRITSDTLMHTTLFTDCADIRTSTVACGTAPYSGTTSGLRMRDAPAGEYLLRLQAASTSPAPPGPFTLAVDARVPDSTCTTPVGTVSGTGSTELTGSTAASFDDHRGSCGGADTGGPDVVYVVDLAARARVTIDASGSSDTVAYLRATCENAASQIVCAAPVVATALDPGRYYLIVDSTSDSYSVWVDRSGL